jgi:hypothetical protein
MAYRQLQPIRIIETAERLERRIAERFPGSGLQRVAAELVTTARDAAARSEMLRRPNLYLRAGAGVLLLGLLVIIGLLLAGLRVADEEVTVSSLIQNIEAVFSAAVFLGALAVFLLTIDLRLKRRRTLAALHELRSLAHVVDMHQLTKDPEMLTAENVTASSPERRLDRFELTRYLDYSSEMLSIISKVAALYVQGFEDPPCLQAVDAVESLTSGLSRKIWQKITIIDTTLPRGDA